MSARRIALAAAALVAALAVGFAAGRLGKDESEAEPSAGIVGEGTLANLPVGRIEVRAERVVLPAGFFSRHRHGGPTFNFVDAGAVVIESEGRRVRHGEGAFFFEQGARIHSITVLDDARLRVLRLLPPGVEATTEVP